MCSHRIKKTPAFQGLSIFSISMQIVMQDDENPHENIELHGSPQTPISSMSSIAMATRELADKTGGETGCGREGKRRKRGIP